MYALLAGNHNFGNAVAQYSGAFMLHQMGIAPKGAVNESAQFDPLWKAVTIAALLPLISLILLPICIPNKMQTEPILTEHIDSATKDSLWNKLRMKMGYKVLEESGYKSDDEPEVAGRELPVPPESEPLIAK
jgi:hypothetical protein